MDYWRVGPDITEVETPGWVQKNKVEAFADPDLILQNRHETFTVQVHAAMEALLRCLQLVVSALYLQLQFRMLNINLSKILVDRSILSAVLVQGWL